MKRLIALAVIAAGGVLALSQVAVGARMDPLGPAGVSVQKAPFDEQFIDMMAAHRQMAIDMAKMALDSAKHPELKALARQIVAAQQQEIRSFQALRKQWYGSGALKRYPMDDMTLQMMGMGGMEKLHATMMSGSFDKAFIDAMIPHHAGAITMASWELFAGSHAKLKGIAGSIIRAQSKEVGGLAALRRSWYGS